MFDYQTFDNRTKSNVWLPNSQQSYSIKCVITKLQFVWFLCLNINTDKKQSIERENAKILPYYQRSVYLAEVLYGERSP